MRIIHRFFLSLLAGVLLAGTSAAQAETALHSVRGFLPDLEFTLQAAGNKTVTEEDLKGSTVMLFFGYASCPDICPTTMAQLSQVMNELGEQADKVRIVFISVDPHRDTPDILQAYVNAFDSGAMGLTGTEKQVAAVARRYRVAFQIEKPSADNPNNYEVAHSRGVYIFDANGKARYLAADTESVEVLTAGVKTLLEQQG
ncbi:SCO family protein [Pusillimonas sp. MFBS29]|uniref:SCO family protein n=1 Tax=Pusillimonas sp. MFBS29 TaxID=2886690 RepID=UPI001D10596F|nr:SCO family protein [Pusillimonas sp. MFBS29]MCC2595504.1 SCO family protein [Pusillimonas sp. MFBS29]